MGRACAATFCVTTNPKRAATWVTNLRRMGAPSLITPRSATNRAASVTVLASIPRTAKYPLSDASANPARPPSAKTSTQERTASGSDKSSPSFCAMSAIDLSIMTVDTGNSTGSAAKPNVPPAAPDAVARARRNNPVPARGARGRVRNATFSAASSPFEVADAIALEANEGSGYPISTGLPTRLVSRQKFTPNSSYNLLRVIRPRGRSRHLAVLAQPVQGLMLTEAAQFEMADFKDRCRNFCGKSTSHEQWPANILAEEFQPAEDVDVAPDGGEVEAIARANIAVCGITIVQSNIDGNMLLDLGR